MASGEWLVESSELEYSGVREMASRVKLKWNEGEWLVASGMKLVKWSKGNSE
jgi:hypothetical protein